MDSFVVAVVVEGVVPLALFGVVAVGSWYPCVLLHLTLYVCLCQLFVSYGCGLVCI